jgi:hypothetical protein
MLRNLAITLAVLASLGASARAQLIVGPGSTPEGDYLRGVGIAGIGLGQYNLNTAQAGMINTQTGILWNEYVGAVQENHNRRYAARHAKMEAEKKRNYNLILDRIRDNPEEFDVQRGDALNAAMTLMLDSKFDDMTFRYTPVPLPADIIRSIPFKMDDEGVEFSMQRLSTKGKGKWPIALQGDQFARERRAYERAFDNALDQQIDGKVELGAIAAVEKAIDVLHEKLDRVVGPSDDKLYVESARRLRELSVAAKLLRRHKVEIVVGELERYSGTTVNDLRIFMRKHHLRFGTASNPDERKLFPELLAVLRQQHELMTHGDRDPN